jgi:hypothetical protein
LAGVPGAAAAAPVLNETWESGNLDGWTLAQIGAPTDDLWHVLANPETVGVKSPDINPNLVTLPDAGRLPAAAEGTHVAWFGIDANGTYCASADYAGQPAKNGCTSDTVPQGSLASPMFSLAGAKQATLRFKSWFEIERVESSGHDHMQAEYSIDGGATWIPLGSLNPAPGSSPPSSDQPVSNNGPDQPPSWKDYSFDLSPAAGQAAVRVRFTFNAGDTLYQGFRGWAIDSIAVDAPLPPPTMGATVNAVPESGTVLVKLPAGSAGKLAGPWVRAAASGFVPLESVGRQLPVGSTLDTTNGKVDLITAANNTGGTQDGHFNGGLFVIGQSKKDPLTTLSMTGGGLSSCSKLPRGGSARVIAARGRKRSLFSQVTGRYRTRGRNSSATVRGTTYEMTDTCGGTRTKVIEGTVTVRDFRLRKNRTVTAGHSYFARAQQLTKKHR